ncbi:MAG: DNA polymerase III subunit delta [Bacilli bacterium]|jgi:DNA polymerase III, delta subunit|uniref:DNA polymerase III subunit delta n=1 Tax=human gut metagenome TaxID=408170 RepID=K1SCF6_9ZZZZ|nr:DNA polymerase III subunit delta [Bacilli bacterium]CDC61332.1 dNA polymerase III delta subunit [Clostridium sp. CAG:417]
MKNNYLLVYDNYYLFQEKLKDIISSTKFENASITNYDLEEEDLYNALLDLDTYSFLTEQKVIIIKNINLLEDNQDTKHLLKYLDNPNNDNLLILTTTKFNATKKINKELKKKTNYIKLETDLNKEIKNILQGYEVEAGVITKLIEYSNNNIDIIKSECDKLKQYKFDTKKITKEDVETIVIKHIGESTQIVFDLIKDIAIKDKKRAIIKYEKLKKYNVDDIALIGLLESQLRLMIQIIMFSEKNYSNKDIAATLNIHPYRIEKTKELLRYSNKKDVCNMIKNLSNIDYKIKSGQIDNKDAIFMYIINN